MSCTANPAPSLLSSLITRHSAIADLPRKLDVFVTFFLFVFVVVCIFVYILLLSDFASNKHKHKRKTECIGVSLFARILTECLNKKNK